MISTAKCRGSISVAPGTQWQRRSRQRWLLVVIMSGNSGCGRDFSRHAAIGGGRKPDWLLCAHAAREVGDARIVVGAGDRHLARVALGALPVGSFDRVSLGAGRASWWGNVGKSE